MKMSARSSQSLFRRPLVADDSLSNQVCWQADSFRPLTYVQGFVLKCNSARVAAVLALLSSCRPAAISRLVVPGSVNTIKRCTLRSFTHVSQKILKRLLPSGTDHHAFSSVSCIGFLFGIQTTSHHSRPTRILGRPFAVSSMAMSCVRFVVQATATLCCSVEQLINSHQGLVAALAEAFPINVSSFSYAEPWCVCSQPSEFIPGYISIMSAHERPIQ